MQESLEAREDEAAPEMPAQEEEKAVGEELPPLPLDPMPDCLPLPTPPSSVHQFELDAQERVLRIGLTPGQPLGVSIA